MAGVDVLAFHVEWNRRRIDITPRRAAECGDDPPGACDCGRPRGGIALGGVQRVKYKLSSLLVQHE